MHALIVVAALFPPVELRHLGEVVALWSRAHDAASWRAAAEQLDAEADSPDLARAAVTAWAQAVASTPRTHRERFDKPQPEPLSDDEQHLVHAIEVALPTALDRSTLVYERGMVLYRRDRLDEAVVAFQAVVDASPSHQLALFSANLWLDSLDREARYDELLAAAVRMRVDHALLAARPELAQLVARLYAQGVTHAVRAGNAADHVISAAGYCATVYMDAFRIAPATLPERDELLFEAALCSAKSGDRDEAARRFTRLRELFPRSRFLARVPEVGLEPTSP